MATRMRKTAVLAVSLLFAATVPVTVLGVTSGFVNNGTYPYNLCTKQEYYQEFITIYGSDVLQWPKEMVVKLITETHRKVLDNVAMAQDGDDIIKALMDLWDYPEEEDRLTLLYSDLPFPASLANTQLGWEKEDIWPEGRGWSSGEDDEPFTDIYGKAPADATVRTAKQKLFFGSCGQVESADKCAAPATTEAGNTTEQDGKVWKPPEYQLGDVARALFYFEARYGATLNLTLSDCPPFQSFEFGYLSELLAWHEADPVSEEEIARNDLGCVRWQGNRNVFVDYPELVQLWHPEGPDELIPNSYTYSNCTEPTMAPTATPNDCRKLQPGDIPIFLVNSLDPDEITFLPLVDIYPNVGKLYVTDNAWDGTQFILSEGVLEFEVPSTGLFAGEIFSYGGVNNKYEQQWIQLKEMGNSFDLNTAQGDNIFLYCLDADDLPNFITGWSNAGAWLLPGLTATEYGAAFSSLPTALEIGGSMFIDHVDNCVYVGPENAQKQEMAANMIDSTKWDCVDESRIELDTSGVRITRMTLITAASLGMITMLLW